MMKTTNQQILEGMIRSCELSAQMIENFSQEEEKLQTSFVDFQSLLGDGNDDEDGENNNNNDDYQSQLSSFLSTSASVRQTQSWISSSLGNVAQDKTIFDILFSFQFL